MLSTANCTALSGKTNMFLLLPRLVMERLLNLISNSHFCCCLSLDLAMFD